MTAVAQASKADEQRHFEFSPSCVGAARTPITSEFESACEMTLICEFCAQYQKDGECRLGLRIPKRMSCRDFDPTVERFCSNPADFVNEAQLVRMTVFFDIKGQELKKIRAVATREETRRSETGRDSLGIKGSDFT